MTTRSGAAPAITAVIPAYRSAARLGTAIGSVLAQDGIDARVIVVVDDQLPETEAAARHHGPAVQVIVNASNLGSAVSRNVGLERVETPFVIFLDSDDWVEGRLLAGLCNAIVRDGADFGLGTYVNLHEATGVRELHPAPVELGEAELFEQWMVGQVYVPPCSVVWRTDRVRGIGGWDLDIRRGDDAELACRALLLGCRFATSLEGEGIYLFHESPHRVSRQSSRCADLKAMIDKLVALPDVALPRAVAAHAASRAYYEVARIAFLEDDPLVGRAALAASRAMGFTGDRGSVGARALGRLVGLENRLKLRRLLGRR